MGLNWAAVEQLFIISSPVDVSNLSSRGDLRRDPDRCLCPRTIGIAVAGTRYESSKHLVHELKLICDEFHPPPVTSRGDNV